MLRRARSPKRTAQEYNRHKGRQGAFWEDRYHATDEHLHRCLAYIDLNMVRAGVVNPLLIENIGAIVKFSSRRSGMQSL